MKFRFFPLFFLLAVAVLPSGCASSEEAADDQMNAFQSTPEKPEDSHGWGANVEGMGGGH
jgi:hypothetical protein